MNARAQTARLFTINSVLVMVGYSLFKAVSFNSYTTNFAVTGGAYGYISQLPFMFSASAGILVAAIIVFVLARIQRLRPLKLTHTTPLLALAACYIFGPLLMPAFGQPILLPILGFIWGFTTTAMTINCIELFTHESSPIVIILQLACGSFVAALIDVLLAQFSQLPSVLICVLLSVVCIPIFWHCRNHICAGIGNNNVEGVRMGRTYTNKIETSKADAGKSEANNAEVSKNGASKASMSKNVACKKDGNSKKLRSALKSSSTMIMAYFFFELVVGLINMFAYEGSSSFSISTNAPIQGMLICSVLVVVFVFVTSRVPSLSVIYLFVFPLIITIFLVLPFFGEELGPQLSSVIYTAYVLTSMLTTFCYVDAIRTTGANVYQIAAIVSGGVRIMLMIGIALGYAFSNMLEAETYVRMGIVAVSCVYFLGIVLFLWSFRNSRNSQSPALSPDINKSYEELVADRVEELVTKYSLTQRERDVLLGLSKGHSAARIGEDLFISTSTVQGYIKTLYPKLGVNKKQ